MIAKWQDSPSNETGNFAIPFALSLILLLGVAALVIDLGRAYSVRREMQKAAEAGANVGATFLFQNGATTPDWDTAITKAAATVKQNSADGALFSDFDNDNVQVGYWDTTWTPGTAPPDLNGSANYASYIPTSSTEIPAVKVSIAKTQGGTGSNAPLATYLASVIGFSSLNMQISAVAIRPSPTGVSAGDCFPMAMPESYVTANFATNPPTSFRITPSGGDGNWTSFTIDSNNVPTVRDLIDTGNPTSLHIGDPNNPDDTGGWIWIEPGVKSTLYDDAVTRKGQTMIMCVVGSDCESHSWTPIKNFVAFYIEDAGGSGESAYIQGHFVPGYTLDSGTGATNKGMGTYTAAKMVQ